MTMLIGNEQAVQNPGQTYVGNSQLNAPGVGKSIFNGFAAGLVTPFAAANDIENTFSPAPSKPNGAQNLLNILNNEQNYPGVNTPEYVGNFVGNMAGFMLNPINAASGFVGEEAGGLIGSSLTKIAPDIAAPAVATANKFGGSLAGAMLPSDVAQNYNQNTNSINWGGVASSAAINYGVGMALPIIPYGVGIVSAKINASRAASAAAQAATDSAAASDEALASGAITPEEHQFYNNYLQGAPEEQLNQMATKILGDNNVDVDPMTNKTSVSFLTPDDINNLQAVAGDELAADVPPEVKSALSDYIVNSRVDSLTQDQQLLDGLQGFVDHIDNKLAARSEMTAAADKILDDNMNKGLLADVPLSQAETYKMAKENMLEGLTLPENIAARIKQEKQIKLAKAQLKSQTDPDLIAAKQAELDNLNNSLPDLLHPKEELNSIRQELLGNKLKPDYQISNAYSRLVDLANGWGNARALLDRVEIEAQYEKQAEYRNLTKNLIDLAKSNAAPLADKGKVIDYLKNRIESKLAKSNSVEAPKATFTHQAPMDGETSLHEQFSSLESAASTHAENLFKDSKEAIQKFEQLKQNDQKMKDYISCVGASLNG